MLARQGFRLAEGIDLAALRITFGEPHRPQCMQRPPVCSAALVCVLVAAHAADTKASSGGALAGDAAADAVSQALLPFAPQFVTLRVRSPTSLLCAADCSTSAIACAGGLSDVGAWWARRHRRMPVAWRLSAAPLRELR